MIDKKQLIEELLECVKDATDTETQITGLSMCATLMNEVLDEALTIHSVVVSDCLGVKVDKSKAKNKIEIRDSVFRKGSSLNND